MKFREDICGATTPYLRTTRADSAEGFATGLCTSDCVDSRRFEGVGKFVRILDTEKFLPYCMLVNTCHSLDLTSCARLNKLWWVCSTP